MFLSCYRLLLFVDEADAFLRKRSTVSLRLFNFPETLDVFVTIYFLTLSVLLNFSLTT